MHIRPSTCCLDQTAARLLALVLFVFAFYPSAWGQSTFGSVVGTVHDSSGAVLQGAQVKLTNTGKTGLKISTMKATGEFAMTSTCGKSVTAGADCTISVTFSPKTQGAKSGTVTIDDSASSKPQVIELSGTGS